MNSSFDNLKAKQDKLALIMNKSGGLLKKFKLNQSKLRAVKKTWKELIQKRKQFVSAYDFIASTIKSLIELEGKIGQDLSMIHNQQEKETKDFNIDEIRHLEAELATLPTEVQLQQRASERRALQEKIKMESQQIVKYSYDVDCHRLQVEIAEKRKLIKQLQDDLRSIESERSNEIQQVVNPRFRRNSKQEEDAILQKYFDGVLYENDKNEVTSTKKDDQVSGGRRRLVGPFSDSSDST